MGDAPATDCHGNPKLVDLFRQNAFDVTAQNHDIGKMTRAQNADPPVRMRSPCSATCICCQNGRKVSTLIRQSLRPRLPHQRRLDRPQHRYIRHRPIRSEGQGHIQAGAAERIGPAVARDASGGRLQWHIHRARHMRRLQRTDNSKVPKALDVLRMDRFYMFDPVPAVAGTVGGSSPLISINHRPHRSIASHWNSAMISARRAISAAKSRSSIPRKLVFGISVLRSASPRR